MIPRRKGRRLLIRGYEEGGTVEAPAQETEAPRAPIEAPPPPDPKEAVDDTRPEDVDEPEESAFNKLLNKLFGYIPRSVARYLKQHGDKRITELTLKRAPVSSIITRLMDLASLGGLSKAQKRLSYDRLFHLFLEFKLDDGTRGMTEKNETLKMGTARSDGKHTERYPVKLRRPLTLNELMTNALKRYGERKLTTYNALARGLNCQGLMLMLLSASGLLTAGARSFIEQNAAAIARDLPGFIPKGAKRATDAAATINKILEVLSGGRLHLEEGGRIP
jgi:hypothetical protein